MKKALLTIALLSTGLSFAQINRCMTPEAIQYQESVTPGFIDQVNNAFEIAKAHSANNQLKSNYIYTIPVVVHIVHNLPAQNLDDSVIFNQMQILNDDYQRMNADTVNMRSDFDIVKGSPQIRFKLAQIDPNGAPTTGITRTYTTTESFGSLAVMGGDFTDLEKVKSTIDGGIDPWDQSRYLNIWVCNMSIDFFGQEVTALLGYATPPTGLPNWPPGSTNGLSDGVVIQFQSFGSNNPNPLDAGGGIIDVRGRTPIHEVGHYLGLRHIWGDGDCTAQDGIDDTPNADAQSDNDCNPSKNTCTDNIQGVDLPDMIENFMDYSAETCQNSFTQGQVDLMHGVLENQRYDLVYNNPASVSSLNLSHWTVSPNPANNEITIAGIEGTANLELYTTSGQLASTFQLNKTTETISIQHLDAGLYILKLTNAAQITDTKRVIIE